MTRLRVADVDDEQHGQSSTRPRSIQGARVVSAPTEMTSTPVAA